jgi:hypothetical protein
MMGSGGDEIHRIYLEKVGGIWIRKLEFISLLSIKFR